MGCQLSAAEITINVRNAALFKIKYYKMQKKKQKQIPNITEKLSPKILLLLLGSLPYHFLANIFSTSAQNIEKVDGDRNKRMFVYKEDGTSESGGSVEDSERQIEI